ncbi:hypothetical protein BU25DRAFT_458388 [Macroventuria anomochaeta]|uniref:Uncharacterized protein n=1 Tax=Macroventuria anomochaeta TaxID=301207 RepID=A0ACB6S143_9PLEO|nr:uncharacterized protein BU25DRAFT_458388 [Macroventuria anomochaeta]KAF2628010.1 hypothetical protein BU25DRAFT_458388 [Macroventuria anomochaeta]
MAAAATATVIPRADYGAWNVSITSTGGSDKQRTETVTGVYANAQLTDNIPVNCHFQGMLNGEVINKLTCDPESFSYTFEAAGYDDGYLYQLTLTQTVALSGTNVTVKGTSDKFKRTCDKVTGKRCSASDILVQASTAVA